jgi:homoserine kinase
LANGALGAAISDAGLFVFALYKGQNTTDKVAVNNSDDCVDTRISFDIHISKINDQRVKIL